jgi:hypothetical protein
MPLKDSRIIARGALSDLFHFLRFPMLTQRFRTSVVTWITEIVRFIYS